MAMTGGGEQVGRPMPPPGTVCHKIGCTREAVYNFDLHHVADNGVEHTFFVALCLDHASDTGQAIVNGQTLNFRME